MNKLRINILTACLVTLVGIFFIAPQVNAQSAGDGGGQALEIGPPVINLTADPGQTIKTSIKLRDVSPNDLLVQGQVNDFTANGEDGTPRVILDPGEKSPYSMIDWFSPINQLLLKSKEVKDLSVTINIPADAAPGGYFAVVRFTATAPQLNDTGVSLSASLGALILLKVNGDAKEDMSIADFFATSNSNKSSFFESIPIGFVERLQNNGNLHEQPAGKIIITDMFGKDVATVNLTSRNVLPQSIRKFEQTLDSKTIGNKILFGLYHAELTVKYGEKGDEIKSNISFWVIPYKLIIAVILGLIVLFFAIKLALSRYKKKILAQAHKSSAKSRK